jgi:hypothetical protein
MVGAKSIRFLAVLASLLWVAVACTSGRPSESPTIDLRTPEGLATWERTDLALKQTLDSAYTQYQREGSIEALRGYDAAVRGHLDHGFWLYRAYIEAQLSPPQELIPSLEQRAGRFVDVADEYIRQGSTTLGVGIAAEVVHDYSDLPLLTPAQRRAEALLLRYRYRQDY